MGHGVKTLKELEHEFGSFVFNDKKYILLEDACMDGTVEDQVYVARAVCPSDGVDDCNSMPYYKVTWTPTEEFLTYAKECAENCDWCDTGNACDWESPESVEECGCYMFDDGHFC